MKLTWFGHSSIKIETGSHSVYIDPYAGPEEWYTPGTLVLISQFKFDHCNMAKVRKASNDDTHLLGTPETAAEMYPCGILKPGESRNFEGLEVVGMQVVNPHDTDELSKLGFVVIAENKKVYFMGDSDYIPKLEKMKPDCLLIAVGGTYTAFAKEAAKTASLLSPKVAIPIHWGDVVGTLDDAEYFKELTDVPVHVLQPGESVEI